MIILIRNTEALLPNPEKIWNFSNSLSLPSPQLHLKPDHLLLQKLEKDNQSNLIINTFCDKITLEKEINHEDIGKLLDLLNKDFDFPKLLIDKIISLQKQQMSLKLSNYENFHHFASILNTITLNIELNDTRTEDDLNFAVIYIAERTYYLKPIETSNTGTNLEQKIYLCSIISKNNIYSSRKFWVDLINLKIVKRFENKKKMVQDTKNANLIIPTQIDLDNFNLINNNSLFSNIGTKFFN